MFNILSPAWHPSHTDISKCIIGRIAQSIDPDETLTYKYHATNAFILVSEVVTTTQLTIKRSKNTNRLKSLLKECVDKGVTTSISNDPFVMAFYRHMEFRANSWLELAEKDTTNSEWLTLILNDAMTLEAELKNRYAQKLVELLMAIPLTDVANFGRHANQGCKVCEALIAQLLFDGFSLSYLKVIAKKMQVGDITTCFDDLDAMVNSPATSKFSVYIHSNNCPASLRNELGAKKRPPFQGKDMYHITTEGKDAVAAASQAIVRAARRLHLRQTGVTADKVSKVVNNDLFLPDPHVDRKFNKVKDEFNGDPLLVASRTNSLPILLMAFGIDLRKVDQNVISAVEESIFLYNQALYASSVDNSFMLLWTALESMMGIKGSQNDIGVVCSNSGALFSLGAFGRRISSLGRLTTLGEPIHHWRQPTWPDALVFTEKSYCEWGEWLTKYKKGDADDPYHQLKNEPLVGRQYTSFNDGHPKCKDVVQKIEKSCHNVRYQFERLYLTRNRIVHSGSFNEHSEDFWLHLEFYCSRILATGIAGISKGTIRTQDPWDDLFSQVKICEATAIKYLRSIENEPVTAARLSTAGLFRFLPACQ